MLYAFIALGFTSILPPSPNPNPNSNPNANLNILGGCEEVIQLGFDETSLDGQECFNQWCLIRTTGEEHSLVTIECSGILPNSVAEETMRHIWQNMGKRTGWTPNCPNPYLTPNPYLILFARIPVVFLSCCARWSAFLTMLSSTKDTQQEYELMNPILFPYLTLRHCWRWYVRRWVPTR
jgi:hypothetical protein